MDSRTKTILFSFMNETMSSNRFRQSQRYNTIVINRIKYKKPIEVMPTIFEEVDSDN
jgi:hypothetical protein